MRGVGLAVRVAAGCPWKQSASRWCSASSPSWRWPPSSIARCTADLASATKMMAPGGPSPGGRVDLRRSQSQGDTRAPVGTGVFQAARVRPDGASLSEPWLARLVGEHDDAGSVLTRRARYDTGPSILDREAVAPNATAAPLHQRMRRITTPVAEIWRKNSPYGSACTCRIGHDRLLSTARRPC